MIWQTSWRADPRAARIADRHYSRQNVGADQFMPAGRAAVFLVQNEAGQAVWGTSWPFAEYVKHAWAGAWICSIFRNEGAGRASDMILEAVAATRATFGEPPPQGMITFVDRSKVRPTIVRGREVYGWSFRKAGFVEVGETKELGLLALQLRPEDMPPARAARGSQNDLFAA